MATYSGLMASKLKSIEKFFPDIDTDVKSDESILEKLSDDLYEWTMAVRYLFGKPFSFDEYGFLEQLYREIAKEVDVAKGRQVTITEYGANWLLFNLSKHPDTVGLYTTDRASHARTFSNLRIYERAIQTSPILSMIVPKNLHSTTKTKLMNGSQLYYHSAFGGYDEARSYPVDFGVADEVQSTKAEELDVFKQSLSASRFGWFRVFGTGDDEGNPWPNRWKRGTQFHYNIPKKRWVAKNPGATIHSYYIPQQLAPSYDQEEAEALKRENFRRYITEIGTQETCWFRGAKRPIVEDDMRKLLVPGLSLVPAVSVDHDVGPVTMGIDFGGGEQAFTVPWIEQHIDKQNDISQLLWTERIQERGKEKQVELLADLIDAYNPELTVMDIGGGDYQKERLEEIYGWKTIKGAYITQPGHGIKTDDIVEKNQVNVYRSWRIETIIDEITRPIIPDNYRLLLPGDSIGDIEWVIDDFVNIRSKTATSSTGKKYTIYAKYDENKPNDALHSKGYSKTAWYLIKNREDYNYEPQGFSL